MHEVKNRQFAFVVMSTFFGDCDQAFCGDGQDAIPAEVYVSVERPELLPHAMVQACVQGLSTVCVEGVLDKKSHGQLKLGEGMGDGVAVRVRPIDGGIEVDWELSTSSFFVGSDDQYFVRIVAADGTVVFNGIKTMTYDIETSHSDRCGDETSYSGQLSLP